MKDQDQFEEAMAAYKKAISIKPDFAEGYNNLGNILSDQGYLNEAIKSFKKAISIKPDYAAAYSNMGNAYQDQGKLEDAIDALNKAISINPGYSEAWNNLYYPLQTIKLKLTTSQKLNALYPKDIRCSYGEVELNILDYKLHRGQKNEWINLDQVLKSLSANAIR